MSAVHIPTEVWIAIVIHGSRLRESRRCRAVCRYLRSLIDGAITTISIPLDDLSINTYEAYVWLSTRVNGLNHSGARIYDCLGVEITDSDTQLIFELVSTLDSNAIGYYMFYMVNESANRDNIITLQWLHDTFDITDVVQENSYRIIRDACVQGACSSIEWLDDVWGIMDAFRYDDSKSLIRTLKGSLDVNMWQLIFNRLESAYELAEEKDYKLFRQVCATSSGIEVAQWLYNTMFIPRYVIINHQEAILSDVLSNDDPVMLSWLLKTFTIFISEETWRGWFLKACKRSNINIVKHIYDELGAMELTNSEWKVLLNSPSNIISWYLANNVSEYDIDAHCEIIIKCLLRHGNLYLIKLIWWKYPVVQTYCADHLQDLVMHTQKKDRSSLEWIFNNLSITSSTINITLDQLVDRESCVDLDVLQWMIDRYRLLLISRCVILHLCSDNNLERAKWLHARFPLSEEQNSDVIQQTFINIVHSRTPFVMPRIEILNWLYTTFSCVRYAKLQLVTRVDQNVLNWLRDHYVVIMKK